MTHAIDVASFIMSREPMPQYRLQRMLFLCQGRSIKEHGALLFPELFECWKDGPVVRDVYNPENWEEYNIAEKEKAFILDILREYRDIPTEEMLIN